MSWEKEQNFLSELRNIIPEVNGNSSLEESGLWEGLRAIQALVKEEGKFVLSSKMREVGEYAQKIWDEKKVEAYPYSLLIFSYLRHVSDDYDAIAENIHVALCDIEPNSEDEKYSIKSYQHQRARSKYSEVTLEDWQGVYKEMEEELEIAQYKVIKSVKKAGIEGIPMDDFTKLKLRQSFERGSLEQLKQFIEISQALYKTFDVHIKEFDTYAIHFFTFNSKELDCLVEDAWDHIEMWFCKAEHFINGFYEEARFVGDVEEYYGNYCK